MHSQHALPLHCFKDFKELLSLKKRVNKGLAHVAVVEEDSTPDFWES